jgi:hypothetical protein
MALPAGLRSFRAALALSLGGLAGAVPGIYWDMLNGRALSLEGTGPFQWIAIAAGSAACVAGSLLMAMARRKPPAPARREKPPVEAGGRQDKSPAVGKSGKNRARKRRRKGRRR